MDNSERSTATISTKTSESKIPFGSFVTIYDGGAVGVYEGVVLDTVKLTALAEWLCCAIHYPIDGGACHECLDYAGFLLTEFPDTIDLSHPDKLVITIPIRSSVERAEAEAAA